MTANNLLLTYLDYASFWSTADHKNENPVLVRLQQINSMQQALGLVKASISLNNNIEYVSGEKKITRAEYLETKSDLAYFIDGEFLYDRPYKENQEVIDKIFHYYKKTTRKIPQRYLDWELHLSSLFNNLLNFRKEIYAISNPTMLGILHSGQPEILFRMDLENRFLEKMRKETKGIDEILCLLIDPQKRNIDKKVLTDQFQYPDVDLMKTDYEWYPDIF